MKRLIVLITITALVFSSVSCGSDPGTRNVTAAVGGALIGAALTGRGKKGLTRNAWAGAAIGGLLGSMTAPRPPQPAPPQHYGAAY